jgi:hypothetical protein
VLLGTGLFAGLLISGRIVLLAQDRATRGVPERGKGDGGAPVRVRGAVPGSAGGEAAQEPSRAGAREPVSEVVRGLSVAASIQDALLRPYRFPFARPTTLEQVCTHLGQSLGAPVVLDRAALARQNVDPQDTVQLELEGVRLKTGLKLLLDQLGLTFRLVAEDNLMIITDSAGAEDPNDRILSELRSLHRDVHDLQDAIDELKDYLGDDGGGGVRVQKPTIIEEAPQGGKGKPGTVPQKPGDARPRPEGSGGPTGSGRPAQRVPLAGPQRARQFERRVHN